MYIKLPTAEFTHKTYSNTHKRKTPINRSNSFGVVIGSPYIVCTSTYTNVANFVGVKVSSGNVDKSFKLIQASY